MPPEDTEMSRIYLRQRTPPNITLNLVIMGGSHTVVLVYGVFSIGFHLLHGFWEVMITSTVLVFSVLYLQIRMAKGNLISYDDEAVYYRPDGMNWMFEYKPEKVMRYDDIDIVCGDPGKIINFGIMPFEFIRLCRKNWDGEELFMISPFFLFHDEMKELIWFIYEKKPDAFSQEVIDYLNSDKRL